MKPLNTGKLILILALTNPTVQTFGAGMQTQLDNIYGEMENYTSPGSFETMRRSGYNGGRYTFKSKIMNENLLSIVPPSAKGGCGGIDVFGGSYSFVNSDQIILLLRQVASNAKGYAFQLAMDNMCPDCMKWMNELQSKIQDMNAKLGNSCQLAQGILNDAVAGPLKLREKTDASIAATLNGIGDDFGDVQEIISTNLTPSKRIKDANPDAFNALTGNVVYKDLKRQQVNNWFAGGDEELIETIMSMTGTIVVSDLEMNPNDGGDTTKIIFLPGGKINIKDLLYGVQNAEIYDCSKSDVEDICRITPANVKPINIEGLKTKILNAFVGPNGLITYIRAGNLDGAFTDEQKNILGAMPHAIGSKIYTIAPISPEAAESFVNSTIDSIALEYVWRLVERSVTTVLMSLSGDTSTYADQTRKLIKESQETLYEERLTLAAQFGSISEVEDKFTKIQSNLPKPVYLSDLPARD